MATRVMLGACALFTFFILVTAFHSPKDDRGFDEIQADAWLPQLAAQLEAEVAPPRAQRGSGEATRLQQSLADRPAPASNDAVEVAIHDAWTHLMRALVVQPTD